MKTSRNPLLRPNSPTSFAENAPELPGSPDKAIANLSFKSNDRSRATCTKFTASKESPHLFNNTNTEDFYKQIDAKISHIDLIKSPQVNEHVSFLSRAVSNNGCSDTVCQLNEDLEHLFDEKEKIGSGLQLPYGVFLGFKV